MMLPLSLLFPKLETQLFQPLLIRKMLHSLNHLCGSALDFLKQIPVPLELRGQNWTQYSTCSHTRAKQGGRRTLLDPLTTVPLIHPRMLLSFLATKCWLTKDPRSLSSVLLSSRSVPNLYW